MELGSLLARRFERRLAVKRSLDEIAILVFWIMVGRNPCRESSDAAVTAESCHAMTTGGGSEAVSYRVVSVSHLVLCLVLFGSRLCD